MKLYQILIILLLSVSSVFAQNETKLLRFPHIMGEKAVFTYAGDIYSVGIAGGEATQLTSHNGFEMFAKISPDGKNIAFSGQYDGNTEVYIMPIEGGVPKRLTFTATLGRDDVADRMGPNNIVMAWSPDSKNIIFRSRRYSYNSFRGQLFSVPVEGGMAKEVPIQDGGFCSYSPDGKLLAFNKIFREFRTWKYYTGGMADDIWVYDFESQKAIKIFENDAQDIFPMWSGDKIYFLSDRDRTMNLFSYNTMDDKVEKISNYTKYDIKFPAIGGDKIIYENAGCLFYFDTKTAETKKITVTINSDFPSARNKMVDVSKKINYIEISPDGKRVVAGARGDVFTVPAKHGVTRNITKTSGIHERDVEWSPDGKNIAFISDKTGEFEIYIQKEDGSEEAVQLTKDADTYKFFLKWSPDSKKIMWCDKMLRLRYIDVETKTVTEVDKSDFWEIRKFNWSPNSQWITYSVVNYGKKEQVFLYDIASKQKYEVTDGWYSSYHPTFSDDGKYLLFISDRDYNPTYSDTEWNHAYKNMRKIYLVTLQKDTPSPFAPKNDEVNKEVDTTKNTDFKIDFDGIKDRVVALPGKPEYYWNLYAVNNKVFYSKMADGDDDVLNCFYDLNSNKETKFGTNLSFSISANNKKMLVSKGSSYYVVDLPVAPISLENKIDFSNLKVFVNYEQEWNQIYDETWRQMRDFFYDPNMHGVNWDSIHDKYAVLLPYVKHRNDLTYLMGEMIGELNIGHAYVGAGERPKIEKVNMGLLGATFSKDASGYFKVDKILKGANWSKDLRSPLTEIGVNIAVNDFIIEINGTPTNTVSNIYELLIGTAGQQIELTVNSQANKANSRKIIVVPLADESSLYYFNWVEGNLKKVNEATNGQVGYIHIPDMGVDGLNQFARYYYPQVTKKGIIIDDRGNGGGNVSPMIIERLRRELTLQRMLRNVDKRGSTPEATVVGPKVLLINEYSASDGDLFPYKFKQLELGTIIGKRTWGGVTGIRGSLPFVDGGSLHKPEFGTYAKDGSKWIIEGHGVDPHIVVENNPAETFRGKDAQLDKAIEIVLEQMKTYPDAIKKHPEFPIRNK